MAARGTVELGDTAKDTITGLTGVVIAITHWLNGCERVTLQPREMREGKPVDPSGFDTEQVDVIERARPVEKVKTGGPHDTPTRQPDPTR